MAEEKEGTRVDLGEDLLEKTARLPGVPAPEPSPVALSPEKSKNLSPDDQVESAKILIAEGLHDEAKRILRQVLMTGVNHGPTRKLLEELHELELKQIFSGQEPRRRGPLSRRGARLPEIDSEQVLKKLDGDLRLGVFAVAGLSLFTDSPEQMHAFSRQLEREMESSGVQDRVDLGIGFFEMGLFDVAARLFESVMLEGGADALEGSCLFAYSKICEGQAYDAIYALQGVLNDVEINRDGKVEIFYLLGRSYELLANVPQALGWYAQAMAIDPFYRDTRDRERRLRKGPPRGD